MLAADSRGLRSVLAALLRPRALVVVGCRVVLVFGLLMGLGAVPLWALVQLSEHGLDLGARHGLVAVVGDVAIRRWILRMGTVAAWVRIS